MTANIHSIRQPFASPARRFARAMPVALTLLVWLFAVSLETGYVAVLNAGIQSSAPAQETA